MKIKNRILALIIRNGAYGVALVALMLSAYQAWLQYQENQYLASVAYSLKTGQAESDIEAALNFAYTNIRMGEGKYGVLRASALEILDPTIGGQCGEFTRVVVLLLNEMGYSAHRVYLFPAPEPGQTFNPQNQPSFHVMAEVWTGDYWAAIDPLRGWVFYRPDGSLATLADLATDPRIVAAAINARPFEEHQTVWDTFDKTPNQLTVDFYQNPQRFNWGRLTYLPSLYQLTQAIPTEQLNSLALPLTLERPHEIMMLLFLGLAVVAAGFGKVVSRWSLAANRSAKSLSLSPA